MYLFESQRDHANEKPCKKCRAFFWKLIKILFLLATVYILFSERLNKYYVKSTLNIERRVIEHYTGLSTFTKSGMPWRIAYTENYDDMTSAKKREI